jgi:exodeoxyribonuclease V alpha subunit
MATLEATVERRIFAAEDGGFAVLALDIAGARETAVGPLGHLRPGETVRLSGDWTNHPRHGKRFAAQGSEVILPSGQVGVERFLRSIDGVGPATAKALSERFGDKVIDMALGDASRFAAEAAGAIPRLSFAMALSISRQIAERGTEARTMARLREWAVPERFVPRILKRYGGGAVALIQENPYRLIDDFEGVGFATADAIARASGVPHASAARIGAGVMHVLAEAAGDGHCFVPRDRLAWESAKLLELKAATIAPELAQLETLNRVVMDGDSVYLKWWFDCECDVARRLLALAAPSTPKPRAWTCACGWTGMPEDTGPDDRPGSIGAVCPACDSAGGLALAREVGDAAAVGRADLSRRAGFELTDDQAAAVRLMCAAPVCIVTGGPGVGKSSIVRLVVELAREGDTVVRLCAPTGRAAKRLSELSSAGAQTIHRLLMYHPEQGWRHNELNPLPADLVICDEASMVDVGLAARLLAALRPGCRLALVGDADQLPSVGPGRVLRDAIESGAVPVARLDRVFRQGAASRLAVNAHRLNRGEPMEIPAAREPSDFYACFVEDPAALAAAVVRMAAEAIPRRLGVDFLRDVWVLSPMHKGPLGVEALNAALQAAVNPAGQPFGSPKRGLRVGDRVMQQKNDYDLDVYNGDSGTVEAVGRDADGKPTVTVRIDDRAVEYTVEKAGALKLAYACTVHKAQGSEYPVVLLACHDSHYIMLQRTLLYTGMTRAQRLLVLCGTRRAVEIAASRVESRQRWTGLAGRLREPITEGA